jgi:hypothetical protein
MGERRVDSQRQYYPLLLAWLPPAIAVAITLRVTSGVPSQGGPLSLDVVRTIGATLAVSGILCLAGVALGLRAAFRRQSGHLGAAWPFLVAAPVGPILLVMWRLFFVDTTR